MRGRSWPSRARPPATAATVSTCCAAGTGVATQTITPYHEVSAYASASTEQGDQISADSTALGNTHGWLTTNGYSSSKTTQSMQGAVTATTETNACCIGYLVGASATAVSNNVTVDATGGAADAVVDQHVDGFGTSASVLVNQVSADTTAAVATATANNVAMSVSGGAASLSNAQVNESLVTASAAVNIDYFDSVALDLGLRRGQLGHRDGGRPRGHDLQQPGEQRGDQRHGHHQRRHRL